ncbi:peptide chain release factor N(5)-glutamine methyltransferase [Thiothrix litoralis]|uniref:peptide chain release factor N(5)-glutamine methyltransferase n=1 Tax=Thiothrix litoralis TaxID=2891210 RepID=UPI002B1BE1EE|nr:peptide chain release factor N(5)-glutamine methyltransferase [Thiothrix litoralis]
MNTKRISWRLWRVNNQALLADAVQQLQTASESARADAEILLAHCLQKSRTYLFAYPETAVDSLTEASFRELLAERLRGVPIAHITGQREFWTLNLKVTPDTLIPRPETELLVETALKLGSSSSHILDLGTGTGAIAIAIASERPDVQVTACDFSAAALAVAQENAQVNSIHNVHFIQSDWFSALPAQRFDMIVSNPPYIEADDPHLAQGDVRFEPLTALASGQDGLDDIRHLIQTAPQWLVNGGWLLLEHGYNQGQAVTALLQAAGFTQVRCLPDLAGNDRVSRGQWLTD